MGPSSLAPLYVTPTKECVAVEGFKQRSLLSRTIPWLLCGKRMEVEGSWGRETGQVAVAISQVEVGSTTWCMAEATGVERRKLTDGRKGYFQGRMPLTYPL